MYRTIAIFALAAAAFAAAAPDEFSTSAGTLKLTPILHASVLIQAGGKVLYIDPAQGSYDGLPQADYILITDIHGDHLAPPVIEKLKKTGTEILAPQAVADKLPGATVIGNGQSKTIGPFTVDAIAAYNLTRGPVEGKLYHDKGRGN